ncbi:MAG: YhfC family intramembrane metalloprotease [Candidatus Marinimicrobia bacterium]|nr:YhfC family intramembrane metalloprotease [Candidatus Neomarinimicrobiota bacterium]
METSDLIINLTTSILILCITGLFIFLWKKHTEKSLKCILFGGLAWAISVAVKAGIALFTNQHIFNFLESSLGNTLYIILGSVWLGILTGITEIPIGYWFAKNRYYKTWEQGIGFGLGFGVFEAGLIALSIIAIVSINTITPGFLPTEIINSFSETSLNSVFVPNIERIIATIIHIATGMLIVYSVATESLYIFFSAVFYKTFVDGVAGAFHLSKVLDKWNPWIIELLLLPFALVGIYIFIKLTKKWSKKLVSV